MTVKDTINQLLIYRSTNEFTQAENQVINLSSDKLIHVCNANFLKQIGSYHHHGFASSSVFAIEFFTFL